MEQNDAQLIRRILQGDQDAFSGLVKKYQKGAHALAWRKIGDFHVAQEITQDAFLTAYKKLGTLRNHKAFAGWLYVIVARLSSDWLRRNRLTMESLDADNVGEVERVSYSQYIAEEQATEADETRREVVKELLKKLPETDGGESWHLFMDGVLGTRVIDLISFNDRLYANNSYEVFQSIDVGVSWQNVPMVADGIPSESVKQKSFGVNTDRTDTRVGITQFALDGIEVYGVGDTGAYRLDTRGRWEQISSEVADGILALAVTKGRLYSAVEERGIFHISLEEAADNGLTHK
ncbi:hypothetical protein C6500_11850 [Candidatus Poribacteria bacterium]|nr:MAG: hypothetical protein C6500_11850 [Candidatus Poribacteria bacterium]